MSDIAAQLRHIYHLDTVQPEHPIRRAVEEIERLRRTVETSGRAIADAQRQISAMLAAPSMPVEHDGPGGVVSATPQPGSIRSYEYVVCDMPPGRGVRLTVAGWPPVYLTGSREDVADVARALGATVPPPQPEPMPPILTYGAPVQRAPSGAMADAVAALDLALRELYVVRNGGSAELLDVARDRAERARDALRAAQRAALAEGAR